jgi:hypothetical protein
MTMVFDEVVGEVEPAAEERPTEATERSPAESSGDERRTMEKWLRLKQWLEARRVAD